MKWHPECEVWIALRCTDTLRCGRRRWQPQCSTRVGRAPLPFGTMGFPNCMATPEPPPNSASSNLLVRQKELVLNKCFSMDWEITFPLRLSHSHLAWSSFLYTLSILRICISSFSIKAKKSGPEQWLLGNCLRVSRSCPCFQNFPASLVNAWLFSQASPLPCASTLLPVSLPTPLPNTHTHTLTHTHTVGPLHLLPHSVSLS